MFYRQFIDELLDRLKIEEKTPEKRAIAGRKINSAYKEICNNSFCDWEQLKVYTEITTTPNYTTGTCDVTNGSRIVNFTGASLSSDMIGRFFQPQNSSNWYKIMNVSGSSITLLSPIVEDSATALTFVIWKRWYYLPSEIRKVLNIGSWVRDGRLLDTSLESIQERNHVISNTGEPIQFTMFGVDPFQSSYSDGTSVSLTVNSDVMTGVGTSWLANVDAGDVVTVGSQVYRVRRVNSDTNITLINNATATLTATSYTIEKEDNLGFQLWYNSNKAYLLPVMGMRRVYDMVNEDYDKPEVPEDFDLAILDLADASYRRDLKDSDWANVQAMASARIRDLRTTRYTSKPLFRQMRPRIDHTRGGYF